MRTLGVRKNSPQSWSGRSWKENITYPADILTLKENIALDGINNLAFVKESQYILCDVGSKYLNTIGIQFADIFSLYRAMLI